MYVVGVGVLDDPFSIYRYTCFGLSGTPAPTKSFPINYNLTQSQAWKPATTRGACVINYNLPLYYLIGSRLFSKIPLIWAIAVP